MKIKNIQQYRTYYKEKVRYDSLKDENFIGTTYREPQTREKKFGWFDIYHGDKEGYGRTEEGISNFLQSFLDMAKDGQAVYEFLQNAVDAGSSHFTMIWGEDTTDGNKYVLVANNGEMFNFNSVRSILNVGSSTKNNDSQNIGKFGIGFKLAHRLVGKDNGLDELINQNSGPILFSWKNNELQQLANSEAIEPTDMIIEEEAEDQHIIKDTNAWLFKILITCFPCLPENNLVKENIKLIGGSIAEEPAFKSSEYEVLSRWVKEYSDILNPEIYNEGSLFFIKLGKGKEADLADKNLAEGVKFSMAILHETAEDKESKNTILKTVQLNRENTIELPELRYLYFNISKTENLNDYLYVRFGIENEAELTPEQKIKLDKEADIEVLYGFREYNKIDDFFKGAPNLYLYFPLSEEVHNFNFILHSNAFYKASSRTFLHKGTAGEDGINERLLRKISKRTGEELERLNNSERHSDNKDFLHLYAALLTSKESSNQDRQWIQEPFIAELNKVLKKFIPIKDSTSVLEFSTDTNAQSVFIKKTAIDVDTWGLANIKWFYWGEEASDELWFSATNKLGIKSFNIYSLLGTPNVFNKVNSWLLVDKDRIKIILNELDLAFDKNQVTDTFISNLIRLKILGFENNEYLSLEELTTKQKDGYVILHNKLSDISKVLTKCGFKVSNLDFNNYSFIRNFSSRLSTNSQLRSHEKLVEIFSSNITDEKASNLQKDEKIAIFKAYRDLNEQDKIARINQLKLFRNKNGKISYTKNILKKTEFNWLQSFVIHPEEFNPELNTYLLDDNKKVYECIISPHWEQISEHITQVNELNKKSVLDQVIVFFEQYKSYAKDKPILLNKNNKWFVNSLYSDYSTPYYDDFLKSLEFNKYQILQSSLNKYLKIQIPDQFFIDYCNHELFNISSSKIEFNFVESGISIEELKSLTEFSLLSSHRIYDTNLISVNEDGSLLVFKEQGKVLYYSSSKLVNDYIDLYHSNKFHSLPDSLVELKNAVECKGEKLYSELVELLTIDENKQVLKLIEALSSKTEVHHLLFDRIPKIELDSSWENESSNRIFITFIKSLISNDNLKVADIQDKIFLSSKNTSIFLKDIDEANDSIKLTRESKVIKISRTNLLLLENDSGIKTIQEFANKCISLDLINRGNAEKLFKLTDSGVTDELFNMFHKSIKENQISNIDQLAFVILSGKIEEKNISSYKVKALSGDWLDFKGNWLFPMEYENGLFNNEYVLSSIYCGIQELLQINDLETYVYGDKSNVGEYGMDSLYSDFLFQKACSSNVFVEQTTTLDALKHLHKQWKKTPIENKISKSNEKWEEVFGFNPKHKVIGSLIIESENLEEDIINWIDEDLNERTKFLNNIGFQTSDSSIIKLRNSLLNEDNSQPEVNLTMIDSLLLSNTLIGLADGFGKNNSPMHFGLNDGNHSIIDNIITYLIDEEGGHVIRLPYYVSSSQIALLGKEIAQPYYLNSEIHQSLVSGDNQSSLDVLYSHGPIIHLSEVNRNYIESNYTEYRLDLIFEVSPNFHEHTEPFYTKWSENNKIKLIRCENIAYEVIAKIEDFEISLGIIEKGNYYIKEGDNEYKNIYYYRNISLEALSLEIKEENENLSNEIDNLVVKRNKTLASFYNALNSSGREDFDSDIAKSFMDSMKQKNIEDEREELIKELQAENKYSYNWFNCYLKYLLSFEQIAETTTQKSISFQKISSFLINGNISDKYFLLEGANSLIPVNIEVFDGFSVTLVLSNHKTERINIEGVSKKGQDLLVYCPKGIDVIIKSNFKNVVNIKINFSPVLDLLQRLYTAFVNEEYICHWDDIQESTPSINFLYGPPGTGKTTTISNTIITEHKKNPIIKCLVLTPTNKAGDVLAKKIVDTTNMVSVIRLGRATSPELEAIDEEIYQNDLTDLKLDSANVIISSIHRLPYYQVNKEEGGSIKLFNSENKWDYIIFDEASMINLPYLVFALMAFKQSCPDAEIIIAGDPKQIPPVIDTSDKEIENLDMEDENIYKMFGINDISTVEQDVRDIDTIKKLTTQYRSVQEIGQIFSEFSYQNSLIHHRQKGSPRKGLPKSFINKLSSPVSFINIPIDINNSVTEPKKLFYSSYHVHSCIFAAELIKHLDNCNDWDHQYNIGIISPYKAQSLLVNKLITSMDISLNISVHCDTVHGFQGDECDIIIFLVNPNNTYFSGHKKSLLSKEYIYNVAISRAQDYLWIMNPYQTIKNNHHINEISNIYKSNGGNTNVISSNEIEEEIFKDRNFIINNSYLTGHDSINVFGSVEMKYFIKASETAIDIQLRNKN